MINQRIIYESFPATKQNSRLELEVAELCNTVNELKVWKDQVEAKAKELLEKKGECFCDNCNKRLKK